MNVYMLLANRPSALDYNRSVTALIGIYQNSAALKCEVKIQTAVDNHYDEYRVERMSLDDPYLGELLHSTGRRVWDRDSGMISDDEWAAILQEG
mgnify:CR=1 FL=1|tara:strand:+ start:38625 stop:38906 length:282 start_codon:yes stop_codon:yes gene_type:complete